MSKKGRRSGIPRVRRRLQHAQLGPEKDGGHGGESAYCKLVVTGYNPERFEEKQIANPAELKDFVKTWRVVWIDAEGLGCAGVINEVAKQFDIHQLIVEDILAAHQRAKLEQYGDN